MVGPYTEPLNPGGNVGSGGGFGGTTTGGGTTGPNPANPTTPGNGGGASGTQTQGASNQTLTDAQAALTVLAMRVIDAQAKLSDAARTIQRKNDEILRLTLLPGNDSTRDALIADLRSQIVLKDQEIGQLRVQLSNATSALGGSQLVSMTATMRALDSGLAATIAQVVPIFNS
jgi:hypothetical protein